MGTIPKCFYTRWMNYSMSMRKSRTPEGQTKSSCWPMRYYVSANRCTDRRNGIEKTGMPDALALLNVEDVHHLEHLAWAVYDGVLLVGPQPKLSGNHPWCTVLAGLQQHIYRGEDTAHCLPQTLSSWDHQERVEALHHVGGLRSVQSGWRRASQSLRRS